MSIVNYYTNNLSKYHNKSRVEVVTTQTRREYLAAPDLKQLAESQAEIYRIFSHANRIQIFWLLMETEMSVNDIAEAIESSVQNTSQHLRLMKAANILDTRRSGQTIYYRIAETDIGNYCRRILEKNLAEFRMSVM